MAVYNSAMLDVADRFGRKPPDEPVMSEAELQYKIEHLWFKYEGKPPTIETIRELYKALHELFR